jgi:hypothetical protein
MGPMSDYEYFKHCVLNAQDASGEINLEGITFPQVVRPRRVRLFAKRCGERLGAFFRLIANSIKETPAEYNARVARRREDHPPVRGLW